MSYYIRKVQKEMRENKDGTSSVRGLWGNVADKKARGETMRKPGSKGAPTDKAIKDSQS